MLKDAVELTFAEMDNQAKNDPKQFTKDFLAFRDQLLESEIWVGTCVRTTRALADTDDSALGTMLVNVFASMVWNGYRAAKAELQSESLEKLLGVTN